LSSSALFLSLSDSRPAERINLTFCIAIVAIAVVLTLLSGLLHFLLTVVVVLTVLVVIWKWPHSKYLPFLQKLRFAGRIQREFAATAENSKQLSPWLSCPDTWP